MKGNAPRQKAKVIRKGAIKASSGALVSFKSTEEKALGEEGEQLGNRGECANCNKHRSLEWPTLPKWRKPNPKPKLEKLAPKKPDLKATKASGLSKAETRENISLMR